MKRKLYFFIERLEISKNERISITVLMVVFSLLSTASVLYKPSLNYNEAEYTALENFFMEKSRAVQQEEENILARYQPVFHEPEILLAGLVDEVADTIPAQPPKQEPVVAESNSGLINVNEATAAQLQELPGIGPAYASRIIEWRQQNGRFTSREQLLEIKGIGEKRLENIRPLITL